MIEGKRFSIVKPTVNTPFHVDFEWWKKNERDWHVYLRSLLCPEHQEAFADVEEGQMIDWVDPATAEVKPVEGIGNAPMSSKDMGARLNRPPETILRTLAGPRVYKGIRPYSA